MKTLKRSLLVAVFFSMICGLQAQAIYTFKNEGNPFVRHKFAADPATLVDGNKLYVFASHDEDDRTQRPHEWLVFSTSDMQNWVEHPIPLKKSDFSWTNGNDEAWAAHVVKKGSKYYMYVTIGSFRHPNRSIGVAVSDRPEGPYKDALGRPMLAGLDGNGVYQDPCVFVDADGEAYMFWGGGICYYAKLKDNMMELAETPKSLPLHGFNVGTWVHKHKDWYYLSYGLGFPTVTGYVRSKSITGPWEFQYVFNNVAYKSPSNHHAIVDFKGKSYILYHDCSSSDGVQFQRSICVDDLTYGEDGKINEVIHTPKRINSTNGVNTPFKAI